MGVTDVLNKYSSDSDVTVWLNQAHLAKSLLKLKDLAVVIPLFLDGPAFVVYDRLSDAEKQDANKIEVALRTAFAADKSLAYNEFRNRVWRNGETVDVFLADLKLLAHLANIKFKDNNEEIIKLAFVMGLPSRFAAQLRATSKIETLDLNAVLQISQALMSEASKGESFEVGAVAQTCESKPNYGCFVSEGPHYCRNCPKVKDNICYACNKPGHVARNCKSAGNGKRVLCALTITPQGSTVQSFQE